MNEIVRLKDIHKYFWHKTHIIKVLKGINLKIEKADTIAITGASGSGKTTLLNIIGGLEPPTKGKVYFFGSDLYKMEESRINLIRNRHIGFVFQFHYLLPELTAIENIMLPALIAGYSKKEASDMAMSAIRDVGLEEKKGHKPGELSGGEQQRIAIARAIVMSPEIILADEPTGNLDRITGKKIAELLLNLNRKKGIAIVVATHNLEIAGMMKRRLELKDGILHEE